MQKQLRDSHQGAAALISVFIMGAVLILVAVTLSLVSVSALDTTTGSRDGARAFAAAEACLDEALLRLIRDATFPGVSLSGCSVTVSGAGNTRTLRASANVAQSTRTIEADFDIGIRRITRWIEPTL
ncbi:MAG: hypothetical protein A2806_02455 [Candidatus Terrybacteria bacterium RIFCSPHIGHO2_01_FULL_48_17]|uniref:Type 4 fimbrial biogenesis protein PilX N-terminal domain-containing protein n=1 Tax=Candidatus Terrybacteria bacterium RIFCSPHIGHO2_01_FULL_48_17 TaxID=1802362 RepID=A0A1G2PJC8_9BACT|nr:MAG: hypothetical protein A2806_02455 [Candidatus Terrybacteria bacterium RIFCSPHIGHO2_01_FULL_48_17]OHA53602.1 MAG: hypothetical protein A3A30_00410 [Candidatus Terrybacteria bacterium RIFCSPLOWO2_01_FULL_48_14]